MSSTPTVFISYSHKDETWKKRLVTHLSVLEQQGLLQTWNDRNIGAGDEWFEEIRKGMESAKVAILLISANFLSSNFILRSEVPRLLERRECEGMIVFPVICKNTLWKEVPWLAKLQARPRDGKALASFRGNSIDAELTKIGEEILELLRNEDKNSTRSSSPQTHQASTAPGNPSSIDRQLQIAEQHNRLLEAQMQPLFRFVPTTKSVGSEIFDSMELWNDGAPLES
jgi:TIR domain